VTDYFLPHILNIWFEMFFVDFSVVLKIKSNLTFKVGVSLLTVSTLLVIRLYLQSSQKAEKTASLNKSMAVLWCFLRDKIIV
jgi:hypothetical protein